MLDITLRPLKDTLFDPLSKSIPPSITPLHLTALAFLAGLASCIAAAQSASSMALTLWLLNRILDCLDGAVARHRTQSSDLGGFLDLLSDFIIYSAIPICCSLGYEGTVMPPGTIERRWLAVAIAEATFHVNNFVLFFIAAVVEKKKAEAAAKGETSKEEEAKVKELTSVSMRPALVEGAESGAIFTVMLAQPMWTEWLCWLLSAGVVAGIAQRVSWTVGALRET